MCADDCMEMHVHFYTDMLICYGEKLITTSQQNGCVSHYLFNCHITINILFACVFFSSEYIAVCF